MQDQNNEILIDCSEEEDYPDSDNMVSDDQKGKRKIYIAQGDLEVQSLHRKHQKGKLMIQPEFQRQFVWDKPQASRLIESALLDIPLPVIYISEEPDNKEYVIDGQQRLTSFFSFIDGVFPDQSQSVFKLTGLRVFNELNKKKFSELSEEQQDKILGCTLRTITFKKESNSNLKFEIFERLNTGSVSLNPQELRNCIYRGPYNDLLRELSQDSDFRSLFGITEPAKRMRDVELVLRFAAFYHQTYLHYKPSIKSFLNLDMERWRDISGKDADELRKAFKNSVTIVKSLLGNHAFKRFHIGTEADQNGYWEPKQFNASLYDILMFSFAKEDKNKVFQNLDAIREALIYLMTSDQEFINSIVLSTSSAQAVNTRFEKWRDALQQIIGVQQKEDRCFSAKLKQEFFDRDPTCSICGQKIQHIDDAAMDHIQQYSQGGKTIPENARLTHRYCNLARSRTEQNSEKPST